MKRPPLSRAIWIVGLAVAVLMVSVAASWKNKNDSTSATTTTLKNAFGPSYKPASPFHPNATNVPQLVAYAVDAGSTLGLAKAPRVSCANHRCTISYEVGEPPTRSFDEELVLPTRRIFKAMFDNKLFRRATILVRGPTVSLDNRKRLVDFFRMTCTRADSDAIDWNTVTHTVMESRCDYRRLTA